MALVVGDIPSEIRVTRDQYLDLLARLRASADSCSHEVDLANDVMDLAREWIPGVDQVAGQLELPLEWAETRATR